MRAAVVAAALGCLAAFPGAAAASTAKIVIGDSCGADVACGKYDAGSPLTIVTYVGAPGESNRGDRHARGRHDHALRPRRDGHGSPLATAWRSTSRAAAAATRPASTKKTVCGLAKTCVPDAILPNVDQAFQPSSAAYSLTPRRTKNA